MGSSLSSLVLNWKVHMVPSNASQEEERRSELEDLFIETLAILGCIHAFQRSSVVEDNDFTKRAGWRSARRAK